MWLRQSTASQEIQLGRFVDSTDGDTEETGLTIANTDIKIWKAGATVQVNKNLGGATHDANGMYSAVLDATDSNTLGNIEINVHVAGALSVKREFIVVPANVYDSLVLGTDTLTADVTQLGGVTQSATDLKDFADAGYDPVTNKVQGVVLVDTLSGHTPQTGDSFARIGANGAGLTTRMAEASINTTAGAVDTVTALTNKTGFSLSTAGILAIWDQLTSALTTASTIGKLLVDNINATISSRMAETSINTTGGAVDLVTTTTTNTDMRGTDGANTVIPDAAGVAPTAVENRQEMDANSTQFASIKTDTGTTLPALLNDIAITKNASGVLHIEMVLATDGRTPATGLVVTGQRLIDSGTYVNVSGIMTEVSNGTYRFDYLAADSNGDTITWKFSAATADDTKLTFLTVA